MTLSPAPSTLGLHSPELGFWFEPDGSSATMAQLAAPAADLSVPISLPDQFDWHAPTHGTRSYFVADGTRPAGLARYRNAAGQPAFTTGNVVVVFELWPEAEVRLDALTATLPRPDGSAADGTPTRPRVHALALEFSAASLAVLETLREDFPSGVTTDDEKLDYLGLAQSGGSLTSGSAVNPELRQVGTDSSVLVSNKSGANLIGSLWAFDPLGRPIDPGAVASWWARLATNDWNNLWSSATAADNRTATVADALTVHLVDPHEGPLSTEHLARLTPTGLTVAPAASEVFTVDAAPVTPTFALSTAPSPDDAPIPRLALLPFGSYGTIAAPDNRGTGVLASWASTAAFALTRDFVRLAFVDVESHLVGLDRTDATQADANLRVTAQINTAATPFASTTDAAAAALLNVLTSGTAGTLMSPVLDATWGATLPADLAEPADPDDAPVGDLSPEVFGLAGEGRADGTELADQTIVVRFEEQLPPDAWIRLWAHGFDTITGRRFRADGGGGRADGDGTANVVMRIADGAEGRMLGFDAVVVTPTERKFFGDERFVRPDLAAGSKASLPPSPDGITGATLWICEQGVELDRTTGNLRSGDTLLAIPDDPATGTFALVDPTTFIAADFVDGTLLKDADGDELIVTVPAFGGVAAGDLTTAGTVLDDSTLSVKTRVALPTDLAQIDEFDDWVGMGNPIPSMERREAAAVDDGADVAALGTTPGRARHHENPPAGTGHVGVVASNEIHGTGVSLGGPAAHPLVALLRERRADTLEDFVNDAVTLESVPVAPAAGGPSTWAVTLETLATGAAGDPAIRAFLSVLPGFLPGDTWEDLRTAIEGAVRNIPGQGSFDLLSSLGASLSTAQATQLARALDDVILKTRDGRRQTYVSMQAAIERAQDFVYIETPAIDELTAESGDIDIVGALARRLTANPALQVLVCVPHKFLEGQPTKLEELRRSGVGGAMHTLAGVDDERVVFFTPVAGPDRPSFMSSTTVIVDDAILITGTTHLWRRGLTFDSSLAAALFDDTLTGGRPALVRAARRTLLSDRLGIDISLVSDDPVDLVHAARLLNARGGLGRVDTEAYAVAARVADAVDDPMWLPDGTDAADWFTVLAALLGQNDSTGDDFVR